MTWGLSLNFPQYHGSCMDAWVTYFDIQRKKLKAQGKDWASPNVKDLPPPPPQEKMTTCTACLPASTTRVRSDLMRLHALQVEGEKGQRNPVRA